MNSSVKTVIYNSVSSLWGNDSNNNILTKNKDILKINNILNNLFIDKTDINTPKLVVVGSQSSGKSSLLNSIIGMDILPTGQNMVTRSPLHLELINANENKAMFGEYINGTWNTKFKLSFIYPDITENQKNTICNKIKEITKQNAGDKMNITNKPIYLRIISPNIPNLSLIDLPGLTMVACTDKGQPKNIKQQIKNMIGSYIKLEKTIILAVMPARVDIEADIALDLIKEYDPNGKRTVGILTKLDLMNQGTNITNLLENNVSKDLQLKYGYFGIKNRNKEESIKYNTIKGLEIEAEYFKNHYIYSHSKYNENLGIPSLCNNLSKILINSIKLCLPSILSKINIAIKNNNIKLNKLGNPVPNDENSKSSLVHYLLSNFCRKFNSILKDRGNLISTGRNLKYIFIEYRKSIFKVDPFDNNKCSDDYIRNCIKNCEGNHMTFPCPPIEVLEQILKDSNEKPFQLLWNPSKLCTEQIMNELINLINIIIDDIGIIRFPKLTKIIKNVVINKIITENLQKAHIKIQEIILMEENYIWTDNVDFLSILNEDNNKNNIESQIKIMQKLIKNYYNTVKISFANIIPKYIMLIMIKNTISLLPSKLHETIKSENIDNILREYEDINEKRLYLNKSNSKMNNAKKLIKQII